MAMSHVSTRIRGLVAFAALPLSFLCVGGEKGQAQDSPSSRLPEKPGAVGQPKSTAGADLEPLDPLNGEEVGLAVAVIREAHKLPESYRFVTVTLDEPE